MLKTFTRRKEQHSLPGVRLVVDDDDDLAKRFA